MDEQHFINQDLSQVIRFLENVTSAYADNGKGSKIRGLPIGFKLRPWGIELVRVGYDGRTYQTLEFKVVK